jgi:hypothetical protein
MANYLKLPTNKKEKNSKDMKINKNKKMQKTNNAKKMNKGQKEDNRLNLFGTKRAYMQL